VYAVTVSNTPPTRATPDELAELYLRGRDVPCPGCGYNRRDGIGAHCPECRYSFDISSLKYKVGAKPIIALTVSLVACALAGLVASFFFIGEYIGGSWNFGPWYEYVMIIIAFLTAFLHAFGIRLLFFVFKDSAKAVKRMAWLVVVVATNALITSLALLAMYYDLWI